MKKRGNADGVNKLHLNQGGKLKNDSEWQPESDDTRSVAWGDMDNDGGLDLIIGNFNGVKLYIQNKITFQLDPEWQPDSDRARSVAWGDIDNDGDLDLIVGNENGVNKLYKNREGKLQLDPEWLPESDRTFSVSWGDVDNDDDLDLAVGNDGVNKLYENREGALHLVEWQLESDDTRSVAWGDVDNDGDLDLAVGNFGVNKLYLNQEGKLQPDDTWQPDSDNTRSMAWADVDNDGDLDLMIGNKDINKLYLNQQGKLQFDDTWKPKSDNTWSIAWGDVDNDRDLDLAVGNYGNQGINKLYENREGTLQLHTSWQPELDNTESVAWGDVDNDGDLDLAVGNDDGVNKLYLNQEGTLQLHTSWQPESENTKSMAWGDVDNDGDLDLVIGNRDINRLYLNQYWKDQNNANLSIQLNPPDKKDSRRLRFPYTVKNRVGSPLRRLNVDYAIDGYTDWQPAIATSDTITTMVSTGILSSTILLGGIQTAAIDHSSLAQQQQFYLPLMRTSGTQASASGLVRVIDPLTVDPPTGEHEYHWDLERTGLVGHLDQVMVRFTAYPACVNTCQYAKKEMIYSAPLRVRGMAVRVIEQTDSGLEPSMDAVIHRAPAGTDQFALLTNDVGEPLRTNRAGYLIGHPQIFNGDKLVALLSIKERVELTNPQSISPTNVYTQHYYTSASITNGGELAPQEVQFSQHQTLTVSAENQLVLFNLRIGLEWDARGDTVFQEQIEKDLQRTSEILYDLTNGQAALGTIDVFHDKGFWNQVDVAVTSRNTQRPSAVLGGWVLTPTQEIITLTQKAVSTQKVVSVDPNFRF
ncbi:VCBS repeat-containing protein [Chloroflexi bacterium TSY]|nr:VCBS repeat-containing protein [Chloroflexi bacterium TSY]